MLVEERSLTSGVLLEETKSPEIGVSLSTPLSDSAVTDRTLLASEDCDVLGVTIETNRASCAGRRSQSESRMREIRTSGSMSGSVETEHGGAIEAPANERAGDR